jgi:hypothetical protein
MGASVTEKVIREYKHERTDYPFTNRLALLRAWDTDAKPFKDKPYIIGEDFGTRRPEQFADSVGSSGSGRWVKRCKEVRTVSARGHGGPRRIAQANEPALVTRLTGEQVEGEKRRDGTVLS